MITAGTANNGVLGKSDVNAQIFPSGTITIDMFGNSFYRNFEYKMVTHARVFSLQPMFDMSDRTGVFISSILNKSLTMFGYDNMCTWDKIKSLPIKMPYTNNGNIDFGFIAEFVAELEAQRVAELATYLQATGLKDYTLNEAEKNILREYKDWTWAIFNLEALFGKSTRGKRLKSADRISGELPFVTAGETNEGISDFIGNNVDVFCANTTTIDMFGSAKYRNYLYGGDDHIAVVHTEHLPKYASIFVTTAIHKSSHNGQFDYSNNFYASDADELNIVLPIKDGTPDYDAMELFISAIHKLVIKDVVMYADRKIAATKKIINK